jgi:preprotein translocase subunit YajC
MQALSPLLLIAVFVAFFYFLAIRPQRKRQLEMQKMRDALKPGDQIVTMGGLHGAVTEIEEGGTILIEVSEDTEVRIEASAIARVVPDATAVATAPTATTDSAS